MQFGIILNVTDRSQCAIIGSCGEIWRSKRVSDSAQSEEAYRTFIKKVIERAALTNTMTPAHMTSVEAKHSKPHPGS